MGPILFSTVALEYLLVIVDRLRYRVTKYAVTEKAISTSIENLYYRVYGVGKTKPDKMIWRGLALVQLFLQSYR